MGKIRLSSAYVFLTYPQCDVPLASILDQCTYKFQTVACKIVSYIICHELHEDGSPHRHCWFRLSRAPERVDARLLDIEHEGRQYHGDYQSQKYSAKCAKYVTKDSNYITSFNEEELKEILAAADLPKKLDKALIGRELMAGRPLADLCTVYPALIFELKKLHENIKLWKQLSCASRTLDVLDNEWIWGSTGAGKSKSVREKHPNAYYKNKEEFWDTYAGEDVVVLEDVDESWGIVLFQLKIWADHYPFQAKIKHLPPIKIRPLKIIVTSNYTIEEVLIKMAKSLNISIDTPLILAIERRFKQIKMTESTVLPDVFPDDYFYDEEKIEAMLRKDEQLDKFIDSVFVD